MVYILSVDRIGNFCYFGYHMGIGFFECFFKGRVKMIFIMLLERHKIVLCLTFHNCFLTFLYTLWAYGKILIFVMYLCGSISTCKPYFIHWFTGLFKRKCESSINKLRQKVCYANLLSYLTKKRQNLHQN